MDGRMVLVAEPNPALPGGLPAYGLAHGGHLAQVDAKALAYRSDLPKVVQQLLGVGAVGSGHLILLQ
jgi:hypothetical protein